MGRTIDKEHLLGLQYLFFIYSMSISYKIIFTQHKEFETIIENPNVKGTISFIIH